MRGRTVGLLAFAGAAAGGSLLGYLAERRGMGDARASGSVWEELHRVPPHRQVRVTAADGTPLVAYVHEPTADPACPTIVLAHGYALGARFWHHQVRDLPAGPEGLRVVTYDQRGHGGSGPAGGDGYRLHTLGGDLARIIQACVPTGERCVVGGHSMGGMTVLALAADHPGLVVERVAGAVLCNTAASRLVAASLWSTGIAALGAVEERIGLRARLTRKASAPDNDLTFLLTRALSLNPEADPAHVAFVEELVTQAPNDVKGALASTLATLDLDEALAHLDVPTLVLAAERDRLTPVAQSRALADALEDAELRVIAGVGHHAPIEADAEVTDALRDHTVRVLGSGPPARATT